MATEDKVPHELILMEHVGHGFDLSSWKGHPLPYDLKSAVLTFLGKYLGPPTTLPNEQRPAPSTTTSVTLPAGPEARQP
jgi:hypothetical protein